jgi:hypothetical protein
MDAYGPWVMKEERVQDSDEIYELLIELLDQQAEPLAAQIREEVARGRLIDGSGLPDEDLRARKRRLGDLKLTQLSANEKVVVPYSGDQRLALLCRTLLTSARTMTETRRALLQLTKTADDEVAQGSEPALRLEMADTSVSVDRDPRMRFAWPDGIDGSDEEFDLPAELSEAELALATITALLSPVLEEVQ